MTIWTNDDSSTASSPWRAIGLGAVLVLAIFVAYLPSMNGGFVCDDEADVVHNNALSSWDGLWAIWSQPGATAQYYPLSFTTFWLNYQGAGLDPLGFHLVNVAFHAINALLLWRLLRKLKIPGAWLAAGLFALHPVQVESVAYIAERKNVLSGFFFFCTLLAAIHFWFLDEDKPQAKVPAKRRERAALPPDNGIEKEGLSKITESQAFLELKYRILCFWDYLANFAFLKWYALTLLFYLCALLSKTAVLPLPAVILLMICWRRRPTLRDVAFLVPLALVGVAMGIITIHLENQLVATAHLWNLTWLERCLLAARDIWFYLGKLIWPYPLAFAYPRWTIRAADWTSYLPLAFLATGIAVLWRKRASWGRVWLFTLTYFVALLFLTLGFFNLNMFRFTYVSDHFQYLACIGPLTLAAAAIATAWNCLGPKGDKSVNYIQLMSASALLLIMGVLAFHHSAAYMNAEKLWKTTLANSPDSVMAAVSLGDCYFRENRVDETIQLDRSAIRLDPSFYEAWNNLGTALAAKGLMDQAMDAFRQALKLNPGYKNSTVVLAVLLAQSGKFADSIAVYQEALKHNERVSQIYNNLAWLLATCPDAKLRDGPQAVTLAKRACSMTDNQDPIAIQTLAAASAEAGLFAEAVGFAKLAEQVATDQGLQSIAEKNQELLEQYYLNGLPYHEPEPTNSNAKF